MLRQPDPLAERKCLSFEQAEGIAPAAESPGTQSDFTGVYRSLPEFRALTWRMLKQQLERTRDVTLVPARVGEPWRPILQDRRFIIITASTISLLPIRRLASASKSDRTWRLVREPGWLEFILKHPKKATLVRK